uniref:Reverse transcriptase zinc-binding domain-containing protein n=1 Tax=Brassica oleracea var. oleracea TaxID=109376 RepID=A0A0D3E7G7_BRAOL
MLRERPRCVAARGRSGLVLASPTDENASDSSLSLREVAPCFGSDLAVSLREVAPDSFSRLRLIKTRATPPCRSMKSLHASGATSLCRCERSLRTRSRVSGDQSDLMVSLRTGRSARSLVSKGLIIRVGSGSSISVWNDPWLPSTRPRPANKNQHNLYPDLIVDSLIDETSRTWNSHVIRTLVDPNDGQLIESYEVEWVYPDKVRTLPEFGPSVFFIESTLLESCIAVKKNLRSRGIQGGTICVRCGAPEESINHVLFECPPAVQVWALSRIPSNLDISPLQSLFANMDLLFWKVVPAMEDHQFAWILGYIWKERNNKVFSNLDIDPRDSLRLAETESALWAEAQINHAQRTEQARSLIYPRSLAISTTHRRDTFCWSYTRNDQYTASRKICHLIWQLLTGHVAVTRNLVRRNMRCDNYCPRCSDQEESVTHAIFECPPALQVWSLSSTPTSPDVFPWMLMGLDGQWWKHSTYGDTKFSSTGISFAFGSRSTAMGDGEYASTFDMPELRDRLKGDDCND